MRTLLVFLMLLLAGCSGLVPGVGPVPITAQTATSDCLNLGSDSGMSLPTPAEVTALTSGPASPAATAQSAVPGYFLHVPPNAPTDRPLQVLIVLHGFGGQGEAFAQQFLSVADASS